VKFALSEKSATTTYKVSGHVKVKGAVCSGDKCKQFTKEVDVK
jgi:hypothetical protein